MENRRLILYLCLSFGFSYNTVYSELPCDWSSGSGKLAPYIPGEVRAVTIESSQECRELCLNQSAFICAAVNYRNLNNRCELLVEDNQTAHVKTNSKWEYFIRPICAGIWLPWNAENGTRLTGIGLVKTTNNLQGCMERCLNTASSVTECRAINIHTTFNTNNCELLSSRAGDADAATPKSSYRQYFTRPIWYLESSWARTSAVIKHQSTIGNLPHLFTDIKVPVSGYLVAWQYYLNTVDIDSCMTNATIWRHAGPDASQYKLISSTTLAPENRSTDGVRFQFIQNQNIRVQQNDMLGVIGSQDVLCKNSLVSIYLDHGNINTLTIYPFERSYGVGDEFPVYRATLRKSTPSLRAYISPYLSLAGSPTAYLNMSLSDGQVFLRLPLPVATEDSVVVAGYRIICSTDVQMTQTVLCYTNLVPVTTEVVLLSLPNITRTYHAAVQIARNFKGVEQLEDKLSGVSSAFCTGRSRTSNVIVAENFYGSDDSTAKISIVLIDPFEDDECAKMIKLNYTNSDGEYRDLIGQIHEFSVDLQQGQTYNLAIYLLLADGAEATLWMAQHTTTQRGQSLTYSLAPITVVLGVLTGLLFLYSVVITVVFVRPRCSRQAQQTDDPSGEQKVLSNTAYESVVLSAPRAYDSLELTQSTERQDEVTEDCNAADAAYEAVGTSAPHVYDKLLMRTEDNYQ